MKSLKMIGPMVRYELVRKFIDKNGIGIEIGPSHNPIAPRRDGYRVQIIDHLDRSGLMAKYAGHNVCLDNIEEVDFVWHGQRYAELVGAIGRYDWLIASHVIEHTPDLIAFINDCDEVLMDSGLLILAIPDARFCFDCFRPLTGLARVVDAHLNKNVRHTVGTAVEHLLNSCSKGGKIAWQANSPGICSFIHDASDASTALQQPQTENAPYQDYHAWCFTPNSFRVLMDDLFNLKLISVREVCFIPTGGFEFFVVLGRTGTGPAQDRLELLKMVRQEMGRSSVLMQRLRFGLSSLGRYLRRRWR